MASTEIVWEMPESLYRELVSVQQDLAFPTLVDLVSQAVQRYVAELQRQAWQQEFREFQKQVRASGGFQLGVTKEEVIAKLREQRHQIFEAEYSVLAAKR